MFSNLDGLFALNLDSDRLAVTGAGLAPLVVLAHLGWLAFDAKDDSMPYIAALPHLRFLMCQDTTAGDDGFVALSRSQTIEYIWGRRCYNLRRRGFTALANMSSLRALSVSCRNVDDEGLAALPSFPALRPNVPGELIEAQDGTHASCPQRIGQGDVAFTVVHKRHIAVAQLERRHGGQELLGRVRLLRNDGGLEADAPQSPARALMGRLERGLGGQSG